MREQSKIGRLIRVSFGNALEWYDFCLFGAFAATIGSVFFHSHDPLSNLMMAFGTFAAGFVARPAGGFLFGYLGDRIGRHYAMNLAILLMGLSSISVAFLPGYQTLGIAAPILLVCIRLLQGLSTGGQFGNLLVIANEDKQLKHNGLYAGITNSVAFFGIFLSSGVSFLVLNLTPDSWAGFAWRIPFLLGGVLLSAHMWLSRNCHDELPEQPKKQTEAKQTSTYSILWQKHKVAFLVVVLLSAVAGSLEYISFTYLITYSTQEAAQVLTMSDALLINTIVLIAACVLLPAFGYLSDIFGRRDLLTAGLLVFAGMIYPAYHLISQGGFENTLAGTSLYALGTCWIFGVALPIFSEVFPREVRASGCCAGFGLGMCLCGFSPLIATKLISLSPSYFNYMMLALMLLGLIGVFTITLIRRPLPGPLKTSVIQRLALNLN
ncbi:MFS transporter [Dongshaea marina]|uniref:MFS transporter n=1 Tax=Dongshaea marina TaxID=2047966 RepID=UPI000D3ED637|nr:MFS transporter [Dongshaea marina]